MGRHNTLEDKPSTMCEDIHLWHFNGNQLGQFTPTPNNTFFLLLQLLAELQCGDIHLLQVCLPVLEVCTKRTTAGGNAVLGNSRVNRHTE